jgi:hypothetical protein
MTQRSGSANVFKLEFEASECSRQVSRLLSKHSLIVSTTLAFLLVSATCVVSYSQDARPVNGATGGLYRKDQSTLRRSQLSSDLNAASSLKVHRDPYGKACVSVGAYSIQKTDYRKIFEPKKAAGNAKAEVENQKPGSVSDQPSISIKILEHIISAKNNCSQTVKLKVCYYGTQDCVPVDLPSYGHKETSMGIYPGMQDFRYQYTEQF